MDVRYWGLCESCAHAVNMGYGMECEYSPEGCNGRWRPLNEKEDETEDENTARGIGIVQRIAAD